MKQASKIIIKKYPNRRLYNTFTSAYIKLDDIISMLCGDQDFCVIDAKTNEDITRVILAQIVLEYEMKGHHLIPTEALITIIKFYGHPIGKAMYDMMILMIQMVHGNSSMGHKEFSQYINATSKNMIDTMLDMFYLGGKK